MENDEVDELVEAWHRERADLELGPVEVFSRITRLARLLDKVRRKVVGQPHWGWRLIIVLAG